MYLRVVSALKFAIRRRTWTIFSASNQTTPLPISATSTPPKDISAIQYQFRPSSATPPPLTPSPHIIPRALYYIGHDLIGFLLSLASCSCCSIIALLFYRYVDEPLALQALRKHGAFTHNLYGAYFRMLCHFSACGARVLTVLRHTAHTA